MRRLILVCILAACVGGLWIQQTVARDSEGPLLSLWADNAISDNQSKAAGAIESLRGHGPKGLAAVFERHRETLARYAADPALDRNDPAWRRLIAAVDGVAAQRDAVASRLFWHTDVGSALMESRETGRPILSLRLLGKLTDEYSCANSRFFRTTLYANAEVSQALRDKFVLHWQSVRPVPKVTIDFGDGRTMEGTVTGNSIHYVLDSDGRVIDALPGLYGPQAFLRGLNGAEKLLAEVNALPAKQRDATLATYHKTQAQAILTDWQQDLAKIGRVYPAPVAYTQEPFLRSRQSASPTQQAAAQNATRAPIARAIAANAIATPKGAVESPVVAAVLAVQKLTDSTDDDAWGEIARLHAEDAQLDAGSVALIRSKNPAAGRAGRLAVSKRIVEDPLARMVRNFQNTIAIDTVRNEYTFHRQIHEWLAALPAGASLNVNDLNERVYAELFLTPGNDPWLGLLPADTYTAIENNGVRVNAPPTQSAGGR